MPVRSPFEPSVTQPGHGRVVISLLAPAIPTVTTLTYQYPLKLMTRTAKIESNSTATTRPASPPIHLYLLSYGGGLLPNDEINVSITLKPRTRLVVTTPQGSTKIFKTEPRRRDTVQCRGDTNIPEVAKILPVMSRQRLDIHIGRDAALCYLPDPAVPFKNSRYEQVQTFTLETVATDPCAKNTSSLCVLDWVTQGRSSCGENWDFHLWRGKNEVWVGSDKDAKDSRDTRTHGKKLLLRESLILDDETHRSDENVASSNEDASGHYLIRERTDPHGVVGTLILYGPVFDTLAAFFIDAFASQPRVGARSWSPNPSDESGDGNPTSSGNYYNPDVTWTAARVRAGFVLVKFGTKDVQTAKEWLGSLLREEGSVKREFGEEALLSL